jgi:pimeloyl-ACP methyl ester carboxylesterase
MATFVLLHGAFHGGWCWAPLAGILRARGHAVTTPTQTGLGERRHLLAPGITLETFAGDLVNHLRYEDLTDVVLVGHSFAGGPISKAAEMEGARIRKLVYLDAVVLEGDETPFDLFPEATRTTREKMAEAHDGGVSIPPPSAESFGVTDAAQAAWLTPKLTPHPIDTYRAGLKLTEPPGAGLPKLYVHCTGPDYAPLRWAVARVRAAGWRIESIATGHDAMVTAPEALADLLEREAA